MEENRAIAKTMALSEAKVRRLEDVSDDGFTTINRVALFGAAMYTGFDAIRNIVKSLKESDPAAHAVIDRWLGRILSLQDTFQVFYGEEAEFCTTFEDRAKFCVQYQRAVQRQMVVSAGVDPKAGDTAVKRLQKVAALTQPANAGN